MADVKEEHSPGPNPQIRKGDLEEVILWAARLHAEAERLSQGEVSDDTVSSIAASTGISESMLLKAQMELEKRRKRRWLSGGVTALVVLVTLGVTSSWWHPLLFPLSPEERIVLGESARKEARQWKEKKDYVAALKAIKQAVELDPNNLVARNDMGLILESAGQPEEAKAVYRRMIEDFERRDELKWAYYNLARLLDDDPATREEAIALYKTALEIRPDYAYALNNLGWTYERMARYDDALRYYQAAIDADRSYGTAKRNLQELKTKLGRGS